jgi:23S rRNA (guanosine2251-2'-O)-methyltransferase
MDNAFTNIFGLRAIIKAIDNGSKLNKIYIQKELQGSLFYELNKLIKEKNFRNLRFKYLCK